MSCKPSSNREPAAHCRSAGCYGYRVLIDDVSGAPSLYSAEPNPPVGKSHLAFSGGWWRAGRPEAGRGDVE